MDLHMPDAVTIGDTAPLRRRIEVLEAMAEQRAADLLRLTEGLRREIARMHASSAVHDPLRAERQTTIAGVAWGDLLALERLAVGADPLPAWSPTHQHRKDRLYQEIGRATAHAHMDAECPAVVAGFRGGYLLASPANIQRIDRADILLRGTITDPVRAGDSVVVYRDAPGEVWIRPAEMFDDGRFAPITFAGVEG